MNNKHNVRYTEDFVDELDKIEKALNNTISDLNNYIAKKNKKNDNLSSNLFKNYNAKDISLKIYQSEWFILGVIHHCKNVINYYGLFSKGVQERVKNTNANIVIMYSPETQKLLFEFYALINLSRICLDNLRNILSPVFKTKIHQLPKSVRGFISGSTKCPIYEKIKKDPSLLYLIDIRDCVVHYRSLAKNDNALVIEEGIDIKKLENSKDISNWFGSMFKASFRKEKDNKIIVNIFIPDIIFINDSRGNKKLAEFSFNKRINILSQSMQFTRSLACANLESLLLLKRLDYPKYFYEK